MESVNGLAAFSYIQSKKTFPISNSSYYISSVTTILKVRGNLSYNFFIYS